MNDIAANLARVRDRMAAAALRSGRRAEDILLVAVTKGFDVSHMRAAVAAGVRDLGESRVQEATPKIASLGRTVRWHLVGHLQRNKARTAAHLFDLIHSIDSSRLILDLSARAPGPLDVLLQVNVAGDPQKFGVAPEDLATLARSAAGVPNLHIVGLMTIAPLGADPERIRSVFRRLRGLRDEIGRLLGAPLPHLSMGMTDDFEIAIEEGATMVRIGRAIFEGR